MSELETKALLEKCKCGMVAQWQDKFISDDGQRVVRTEFSCRGCHRKNVANHFICSLPIDDDLKRSLEESSVPAERVCRRPERINFPGNWEFAWDD